MAKNSYKMEEAERVTILLYQEKIGYWQKLMTQFVNAIVDRHGLKPEECAIDLSTGEITLKKLEEEARNEGKT